MRRLLQTLSVVSFVCFLAAATAALFFRARAEAGPPAPAVPNAPNAPNSAPVSADGGTDAGSSVAAVLGSSGGGHYMAASKSFGGAPLVDPYAGLGLRGSGTGGIGTLSSQTSTAAEAVVKGGIDKEQIRKVIRAHTPEIRACYEKALQAAPKVSGKVSVKFVVDATGKVTSSTVAQSTVANPDLETCAADAAATWSFPPPKGGGVAVVTYPFTFQQAAQK